MLACDRGGRERPRYENRAYWSEVEFELVANNLREAFRVVAGSRAGGEVRWIERRSFISYDGDRHPQRVVGVTIDVTERKRAEDCLRAGLAGSDCSAGKLCDDAAAFSGFVAGNLKSEFLRGKESKLK